MPRAKKTQRIITLDIMRGFFLAVIAIDHFQHFPSLFDPLTGRGRLWVSAAEGFFIISGLVVGYIYGTKMLENVKETILKLWRRAALLFGLSVFFTLFFTAWGMLFINMDGLRPGLLTGAPVSEVVLSAITFRYVYGWVDFLTLYTIFMFFAPLAVFLTIKKKGWLVILLSILCWMLLRQYDIRFGWQIFFMPGIVAGYYLPQINNFVASLNLKTKKILYAALAVTTFTLLIVSVFFVFAVPFVENRPLLAADLPGQLQVFFARSAQLYATTIEGLFYKWTLPAGRVVFAWVWFATLFLLVRHFETKIEKYSKGFFSTLGRNSLFTYCLMGVIIFGVHFIVPPQVMPFSFERILGNTLLGASLLAVIYAAAKYKKPALELAKTRLSNN